MQRAALYGAGALVVLVLIKDGTMGQLFSNAAQFGGTLSRGLRPLASAA